MDADFWAAVGLAAAMATALATGVSTLAALWWRRHDRQEVDWIVVDGASKWWVGPDVSPPPGAEGTLLNVGDGTAYRVTARGDGCTPEMRTEPIKAAIGEFRRPISVAGVIRPGDSVYLLVRCEPEWWDEAGVIIEWTSSPTWKKSSAKSRWIPLTDLGPRPVYSSNSMDEKTGQTRPIPRPEPPGPVLPESMRVPPPLPKVGRLQWPFPGRGRQPIRSR